MKNESIMGDGNYTRVSQTVSNPGNLKKRVRMRKALAAVITGVVFAGFIAVAGAQQSPKSLDDLFAEVAKRVPAFGGMYIGSGETLQVNLLDTSPEEVAAVRMAITAVFGPERIPRGGLRAVKVQYSFLQLKEMRDRARDLLNIPGVILLDIDERMNRLRIGLERADVQAEVERQLASLRIPREALSFELIKPFEFQTTLQDKIRPLIGGVQIALGGSGGACTLGFIAVRSGVRGFVTASHCTNVQGGVEATIYGQPTKPGEGTLIGVETVDPVYFTSSSGGNCPSGRRCRSSDSAFVAIFPGTTSDRGGIANPSYEGSLDVFGGSFPGSYEIKGTVSSLDLIKLYLLGEVLTKVGRTTGETEGAVNSTCADINVNKSDVTLLCQDVVGGPSAKGDSGSPVFKRVAGPYEVDLAGILWGGDGSNFGFSPLSSVIGDLGPLTIVGGNDPPTVTILKPKKGASAKVSYGAFNMTTFEASVDDPDEDCSLYCLVTWTSNDGFMGAGKSIEFNFTSPGTRTITVTATDTGGKVGQDSITVTTLNTPPSVWIIKPSLGQTLYKGFPYVFEGSSFDSESFQQLPCSSLKWTSSKLQDSSLQVGFPQMGCTPQVTFLSTGLRTIALTGTDSEGAASTTTVTMNVVDAPSNSPPIVTILGPKNNVYLDPDTILTLKGTAKDPDGKSPLLYKWVLTEGNTKTVLGTGTSDSGKETSMQWKPSNNVPFDCGGTSVKIDLEAKDPDGSIGSNFVKVHVGYSSC